MAIMKEAKTLTFGDTQYVVVDAEAREKIAEFEHNIESGQFLNQRGTGILNIATSPSSYTTVTPDGGTPTYRILLSTVLTQANVDKVLAGDILMYSTYLYPVYYIDDSYVYTRSRTSIRGYDGDDGKDGYTPQKGVDYFDGKDGKDGSNGKDGTSATHSWNGTTLTITSASGTSSANLKGDKGDTGSKGDKGDTGSKGDKGDKGDAGKTPVKGTDYFTESDKQEMVSAILAALPTAEGASF